MAFLAGFLADIFVSYSHVDDKPFGPEETRRVTKFHGHLETRVNAWLGQPITIWRDNKTEGTDLFSEETIERLRRSAILVSIVTPSYIRSDWCKRELTEFVAANSAPSIRIGNKSRVVKVLKTFVSRAELPPILDDVLGFPFYKVEPDSEVIREFLIDPSPEGKKAYFAKLDDVAFEIKRLIELMRTTRTKVTVPSKTETVTAVYLAVSSLDIQDHADELRRELEAQNCEVLPATSFPLTADRLIESIREDMSRCTLSIHPLGARYGVVPENETRSVVELQYELAIHRTDPNFTCVVWIPPISGPVEDRQRALLDRIRNQREDAAALELLETSLEELKNFVVDRLGRRAAAKAMPPPEKSNGSAPLGRIYLVHDQSDRMAATPLRDYLDTRGFEVIRPLMDGEPQVLREDHQENLRLADGVLIYWGAASEAWLRAKMRDLTRVRGLGRTTPFRANGIYVAEPQGPEKQDFRTREAQTMRHSAEPLPKILEPYVKQLMSNP